MKIIANKNLASDIVSIFKTELDNEIKTAGKNKELLLGNGNKVTIIGQ